jgi:hypothetical protein
MANQRSGVPAGWHWRDGRPRWIPSPALRALGFKGRDLKDDKGRWLSRGASIDAAQALVLAAAEVRAGRAQLAAAPDAQALVQAAHDRRSIGALLDAYLASREFAAIRNQIDRRSKLSRLIDVLSGYLVQPAPVPAGPRGQKRAEAMDPSELARRRAARAAYDAARAETRSYSIDVLEPPSFDDTPDLSRAQGPLYDVYWKLREGVGLNMAHGVMADTSAWLEWCVRRRAIRQNWAKLIDRQTPPGRIRVGTWDELRALIASAEALGLYSIADAVILGVDLSWSQVDRLRLTWGQISAPDADGQIRVKGSRQKTGRKGETPLLAGLGLPRIEAIRARQRGLYGPNVTPTHVIVCELTGKAWTTDHYRHRFAEVRAHAAKTVPSVATLRDQDLRDTAITIGKAAKLTDEEIASRSLHSLKRIRDVLDKHYVEIGQDIADAGAERLNAYLLGQGVAL